MPFESSKPGPRDAESLAPELESLADQLDRDAQWLAFKYPAHKPQLPLARPRRLRWVAIGATAVLFFLAVDGWLMWQRPREPSPALQRDIVATKPPAGSLAGAKPEAPASSRLFEPRMPARRMPAMFSELNGAEKEAVLDLLEDRARAERDRPQPPTNTSLSL